MENIKITDKLGLFLFLGIGLEGFIFLYYNMIFALQILYLVIIISLTLYLFSEIFPLKSLETQTLRNKVARRINPRN